MRSSLVVLLFAFLGCAHVTVDAPQSPSALGGYGPWQFGMSRAEVTSFSELGPYNNVSGHLVTDNGRFDGERRTLSFSFDMRGGLERIAVWMCGAAEDRVALAEWTKAFRYLDARGEGVILPEVELERDIRLDEALFGEIFRGAQSTLTATVATVPADHHTTAQFSMLPRKLAGATSPSAEMRFDSRYGFYVLLYFDRSYDGGSAAR